MKNQQRKIAYSHILMRKYGAVVIFLQKYIYGVKTLVPLAMGLTKYDIGKFTIFNFFATIVWVLLIGIGSYILGEIVYSYTDEFKTYGLAFVVCLLLIITYFYRKI